MLVVRGQAASRLSGVAAYVCTVPQCAISVSVHWHVFSKTHRVKQILSRAEEASDLGLWMLRTA